MNQRSLAVPCWRRLRFALRIAQMAGATLAACLLIANGLTSATVFAAAPTTLVTALSVLVFGGLRSAGP